MRENMRDETKIIHAGRHPERQAGIVNPPVYHASTVLSPSLADFEAKRGMRERDEIGTYYGRHGTPTQHALEEAIAVLEGGYRCQLYPSGLAACTGVLMAYVGHGDHILMTDNVYGPSRNFARTFLKRFGVETTFFDPMIGGGIDSLIRANTRLVYVESPGSHTFEVQDVPAIAAAAKKRGVVVAIDNTWATPLYFRPLDHGVDISIQAATKYIVGHSDAMLGTVTVTKEAWPKLLGTHHEVGFAVAPDDAYLGQRGLRTMAVRLKQHWENGVRLAEWIATQSEVHRVMHPALPGDPGHALWKRDFKGASGLFGVIFKASVSREAFARFVDGLELFGIGASWGGFESLVLPTDVAKARTATSWSPPGPVLRIHAGLESVDDLIADMRAGFERLRR